MVHLYHPLLPKAQETARRGSRKIVRGNSLEGPGEIASLTIDRMNALTNSQRQWWSAQEQVSQLFSPERGGFHEPPPVAVALLTTDCC